MFWSFSYKVLFDFCMKTKISSNYFVSFFAHLTFLRRWSILKVAQTGRMEVFQNRTNLLRVCWFQWACYGGMLLFGPPFRSHGDASVIRPYAAVGRVLLLDGVELNTQIAFRRIDHHQPPPWLCIFSGDMVMGSGGQAASLLS